jgi:hypothetical protein
MPVRTIKLKLVVPRGPERRETARALWATHAAINDAVRYYEDCLLSMRGGRYLERDGWIEQNSVRERLLVLIDAARNRNTIAVPVDDDVAIRLLGQFYTAIVPSCIGQTGTAQNANRYLGPLTDPASRGELDIFEKIDNPRDWFEAVRNGEVAGFEAAELWLASDAGKARSRMTGAPPAWVQAVRRGDKTWPSAFVADFDRKMREAQGTPTIVRCLKAAGILPLFPPFVAPVLVNGEGVVSRWDRLAFRLAVAHLLSWESWNRRAADEHTTRRNRVEQFRQSLRARDLDDRIAALRRYEQQRKAELERVALPMGERDFRITGRMVRGWPDLRDKWLRAKNRSPDALLALSANEQSRKRERFGDPHLMQWLAHSENHGLWADGAADMVSLLAQLNTMERLVERSRETAVMTLPDARRHPRYAQWEAEGGSNLRTWRLRRGSGGELQIILPLLKRADGAGYEDADVILTLAPSGQFTEDAPLERNGRPAISYRATGGDIMTGELGSADLLFDRSYLRHRTDVGIEAGDIGPVWLKMALELSPNLPAGWTGKLPKAALHFQTALNAKSKYQGDVSAGLRVLSVDLGLRTFGACSVFELRDTPPSSGIWFPADSGLWAVHERSFLLDLPDADVGKPGLRWQDRAVAELRRLRRGLGRHRGLLRMASANPEARPDLLSIWAEAVISGEAWSFEGPLLATLQADADLPPPLWHNRVMETALQFRTEFGSIVQEWRHRTRSRENRKYSGKSMWSLQYLTDVRRFLLGWSLAGRKPAEIRRLDGAATGVYAGALLDHLDGVKQDRLKTGADLIVQAARGFRRGGDGSWVRAYEPCHIVLFEDLSRYRMRTDRPRRENSQLMKWAHRSIPAEVAMQGELYGLHCLDTGAAFSSRYRAASLTPGIRCHALTRRDLTDPAFRDLLLRDNEGLDLDRCQPGDLIPLAGGTMFACLGREQGFLTIHADINAAQNLQRRFWTRHGEAFRLPSRRVVVGDQEFWVPLQPGKRLIGALGGYGRLKPTGHETGSCRWEPLSIQQWRRLAGADAGREGEPANTDPEIEELMGLEEEMMERSGETVVFFRDPSGVVLPDDLWLPSARFWSIVKTRTAGALKSNRS